MHRLTGPMLAGVALCMSVLLSNDVAARDDGRYANEPLHAWFDQLASGKGLCCSFADGFKVENVDWDTRDGRYRVRLHGEWITVFTDGLVEAENQVGEPYSEDRLLGVLQSGVSSTPELLLQRMIAEVNVFVGATPQHDDITCMVIKAG